MKTKMLFTVVALILVVALIPGCQAPTTPEVIPPAPTDTAAPPDSPTQEVLGPAIQPLVVEVCNGQAQAMAHALDVLEVTQSEAQLDDWASGATGTGCMATVTGNGVKFPSPADVASALGNMLIEQGWTKDNMLDADGPTGTSSGYRKAGEFCVTSVMWEPAASANCPKDQPIMACSLTPEEKLYTITLNCGVEILADQGAATQEVANPASENCIAQGGMLVIQERGDGGQYGVCLFEDNQQCEEWALYNGLCPVGGLKVTGYITPAAAYCAITGGTYTITGGSNTDNEQGTCTLPDGNVCDVWDYFAGMCGVQGDTSPAPTQGIGNPASINCIAQGGQVSIQERGDGGQYGVCLFEDNQQCDEWALYKGDCPVGGLKVTGYVTPAAVYCAITGGTYTVTGGANTDTEAGTCTFKDGSQCDVWAYFNGECGGN